MQSSLELFLNGEMRDRERVMRTFGEVAHPILTGMQIFHNYVRPHDALNGNTPAEAAGMRDEARTSGVRRSRTQVETIRSSLLLLFVELYAHTGNL